MPDGTTAPHGAGPQEPPHHGSGADPAGPHPGDAAGAPHDDDLGEVAVGWVGGTALTRRDLERHMAKLAGTSAGRRLGLAVGPLAEPARTPSGSVTAVEAWATQSLLATGLLEAEAARLGVAGPWSLEHWLERLQATGELVVEEPDEAEVRAAYEANSHRYHVPEARLARHVLVDGEATASALAARLETPSDLGRAAASCSLDAGTRAGGGSLGWVERGQLAGPIEDALFALPAGGVSGPVRSVFGWHVLAVEEVRPEGRRPFAQCRDEVAGELARGRLLHQWERWWRSRLAGSVRAMRPDAHPLVPGLPGSHHRH